MKDYCKKFILPCLVAAALVGACVAYADNENVFHGYAQINEELRDDPEILTNVISEVSKGTKVSMVVYNIINS